MVDTQREVDWEREVAELERRLGAVVRGGSSLWVGPCLAHRSRWVAAWEGVAVVVLVWTAQTRWVDAAIWLVDCDRDGVSEVYVWEPGAGVLTVLVRGRDGFAWMEGVGGWVSVALGVRFAVDGGALVIASDVGSEATGGAVSERA